VSPGWAAVGALGVCTVAAAAEGVCAGRGVREHMARLRPPRFSLPLWSWYAIGILYYAICFYVLYRTLSHAGDSAMRVAALALAVAMMAVNALWNLVFFRAQNVLLSLLAFVPYDLLAVSLTVCLWQFDAVAGWSLVPYLLYLVYANLWCYALWQRNRRPA